MTGFVMVFHAVVSVLLLVIILMQSGRGGGLTEGFASAESMLGAKTNEFMIKATTVFATLFLVTFLGLAVLSSQKGKSLMEDMAVPETTAQTLGEEAPSAANPDDAPIVVDVGEEETSSFQAAAPEQESPVAEPIPEAVPADTLDILPEPK